MMVIIAVTMMAIIAETMTVIIAVTMMERSAPAVLDSLTNTLRRTADPHGPLIGLSIIEIEEPEFASVLDHSLDPIPIRRIDGDPSDVRM
jgi:hypothetical protein